MPADAKVLEYVKACLSAGKKTDDVIADLKKAGWTSGEIADALEEVLTEIDKKEAEKKQSESPQQAQQPARQAMQPQPTAYQPSAAVGQSQQAAQSAQTQPKPQQPVRKVLPWLTEPVYERGPVERGSTKWPNSAGKPSNSPSNKTADDSFFAQKKQFTPLPQQAMQMKTGSPTAAKAVPETQAEKPQAQGEKKPQNQASPAPGAPAAAQAPGGSDAGEFLGAKWLSQNWIYLAVAVLAMIFVLAILFSYLLPYAEPVLSGK